MSNEMRGYCCIDMRRAFILGLYEYSGSGYVVRDTLTGERVDHCPYCHYNRCSRCKVFVSTVWQTKTKGWNPGQRCKNCLTERDKKIIEQIKNRVSHGEV